MHCCQSPIGVLTSARRQEPTSNRMDCLHCVHFFCFSFVFQCEDSSAIIFNCCALAPIDGLTKKKCRGRANLRSAGGVVIWTTTACQFESKRRTTIRRCWSALVSAHEKSRKWLMLSCRPMTMAERRYLTSCLYVRIRLFEVHAGRFQQFVEVRPRLVRKAND